MLVTATLVVNEVLFWVLIAAGLVARYRLRRPRLGAGLLVAAPLVDLVLLTVSVWDLRRGSEPHLAHALAAVYIGVSVGFGHRMVAWADVRYAHRYAGGPAPAPRPAKGSVERVREDRQGWLRHLLAFAVGAGLLLGAALLVGDPDRTGVFTGLAQKWALVLAIDFLFSWRRLPVDDGSGTSVNGRNSRQPETSPAESAEHPAARL